MIGDHPDRDDLVAYALGAADAEERRAIEAHAPSCARCTRELEAITPAIAVLGESVWVACIAGVAVGIPSVYYLAAIAAILAADVRLGSSIAALVVFNVIAFILTEISIVSFVRAPIATRKWVDRLYTWATNRHRLVMGLLPGMVGIYLLVTGISKL